MNQMDLWRVAACAGCAVCAVCASGASAQATADRVEPGVAVDATPELRSGSGSESGSESGGGEPVPSVAPAFGDRGYRAWSVSLQAGSTFQDNTDYHGRVSLHYFVAEGFEVIGSLTGWAHDQPEEDEASAGFDFGMRYHFVNDVERGYSLYADAGIGMMFSSGEVPEGGTRYNFTPRAGLGATFALTESARLDVGVRWQHFSNASTAGSDDNPSRDEVAAYIGVMFEF